MIGKQFLDIEVLEDIVPELRDLDSGLYERIYIEGSYLNPSS